ncbi:LLM class flavin-dependent oxidoreductase [Pararhodobacter zhoushanensis]|uniref:LLM class flavin-dependent oxidoreductase n=1 Tax=Pararhodobacter zhoushanensis TaxID=2479545 RepID=UPI000F8DC118|nr:LLM class flavin-dependent oxidoreductase [Pararhodobacter zhoushanensis]
MEFGVFDHMDASGQPLAQQLADRLRVVAAYDRLGFRGYHVAEHHATPLGVAGAPSVWLAAVAQHTQRIRLGPLIYILPLYHPLRLAEEVCLLDALSQGRLMLGIGRGASPIEAGFFGVPGPDMQPRYFEATEVLMKALQNDTLDHHGAFYQFDKVPMVVRPVQQPMPELWYASRTPESFVWAAQAGANTVTLALGDEVRALTDIYRETWVAQGKDLADLPLIGVSRHIVVAETDAEARALAERAYARWLASFRKLWVDRGLGTPLADFYPESWADLEAIGNACAGSPETVLAFTRNQAARCGVNYLLSWFAFGDLSADETIRSVELFAQHVMPEFR